MTPQQVRARVATATLAVLLDGRAQTRAEAERIAVLELRDTFAQAARPSARAARRTARDDLRERLARVRISAADVLDGGRSIRIDRGEPAGEVPPEAIRRSDDPHTDDPPASADEPITSRDAHPVPPIPRPRRRDNVIPYVGKIYRATDGRTFIRRKET